jgi:hypothetical protein
MVGIECRDKVVGIERRDKVVGIKWRGGEWMRGLLILGGAGRIFERGGDCIGKLYFLALGWRNLLDCYRGASVAGSCGLGG